MILALYYEIYHAHNAKFAVSFNSLLRYSQLRYSIIIPTLNEEYNLKDLLPKLISCSRQKKLEIVIVDAPSSTDGMQVLCDDYEVIYHKSSSQGRSVQMNEGAKLATGDVLIFMHADVRPPLELCENIAESLNHDIHAGYFSYQFDKSSWLLRFNSFLTKYKGVFTGGGDQCLFIKSDLFKSIGGFNDEYPIMEDFELYDRLKKLRINMTIIDKPLTVSARKYEERSWFRVNLANVIVYAAYRLGFHPHKLQTWYKSLLG